MKKHKIEIELEFGSKFQEECGLQAIGVLLSCFEQHYKNRHKKNKITIRSDSPDIVNELFSPSKVK